MSGVLRALMRELAVLGAALLLASAGLVIYREWFAGQGGAPPLPDVINTTLQDLDGLDRRWLLAGLGLAALIALWLTLRLFTPGGGGQKRGPWLLAFGVLAVCAAGIVGLYYAPDEIRITDTWRLRRLPREEFLHMMTWGTAIIGGGHLVLFALLSLLGRARPAHAPRTESGRKR